MDILENRNYVLTKGMLSCFGQWPLQSRKERYLLRTTTAIIVGSIIVPKVIKFVNYLGDMHGMIECMPVLGLHFRFVTKFINCIVNEKKMEMLINRIKESWTKTSNSDTEVLRRYAERGRLMTLIYAGYVASALVVFLLLPLIPIFLDVISPLNETRDRKYPYETEYFLEENEKYFLVLAHAWFSMPIAIGMIVAYDSMFTLYVHHICSMFAMMGERLENIGGESEKAKLATNDGSPRKGDKAYEDIVDCIRIHTEAVECSKLLESSGYICYFFVIGGTMIGTTLTGVMTVFNLDYPREAMRYALFTIVEIIHLFYVSWQGHTLVEHSECIFLSAYNVEWYNISPRAKKLLILIMLRSIEPCKLTAGKIYVLSMENFATSLKTSMSYFTVLMSLQ